MFKVKDIPIHHPDYDIYPSSDGELMAETSKHLDWILKTRGNLEALTDGQDIFVAADLLWYPVQGRVDICKAPDGMVVIGRPKGDRDSYLQWHEDNMPPQVVFEFFSRTNHRRVNKEKLLEFYTKYGVQEYYIYDPIRNTFTVYLRQGGKLIRLEGLQKWTSPLLGIRFEWSEKTFEIYHPDGEPFLSFSELSKLVAEKKAKHQQETDVLTQLMKDLLGRANAAELKAETALIKVETALIKMEATEQAMNAEKNRANAEAQRADAALAHIKFLEEQLKALGNNPKEV